MDAAERKHLAGLTASVERETQAVTERRAIIDGLKADPTKARSLKDDARMIVNYRKAFEPSYRMQVANPEVEALHSALVEKFRADLDALAQEISQ